MLGFRVRVSNNCEQELGLVIKTNSEQELGLGLVMKQLRTGARVGVSYKNQFRAGARVKVSYETTPDRS